MTARPTEVKAVVELLNAPADSVDDLAKAIINTVDELRGSRVQWVVLKRMGQHVSAWGPYPTPRKAYDAIIKEQVPRISGDLLFVVPLYTVAMGEEAFVKADVDPISPEARKCWQIAYAGGSKPKRSKRRP